MIEVAIILKVEPHGMPIIGAHGHREMPGGVLLPAVMLAADFGDLDAAMPLVDRAERCACLYRL
jgi:hypothetical protein